MWLLDAILKRKLTVKRFLEVSPEEFHERIREPLTLETFLDLFLGKTPEEKLSILQRLEAYPTFPWMRTFFELVDYPVSEEWLSCLRIHDTDLYIQCILDNSKFAAFNTLTPCELMVLNQHLEEIRINNFERYSDIVFRTRLLYHHIKNFDDKECLMFIERSKGHAILLETQRPYTSAMIKKYLSKYNTFSEQHINDVRIREVPLICSLSLKEKRKLSEEDLYDFKNKLTLMCPHPIFGNSFSDNLDLIKEAIEWLSLQEKREDFRHFIESLLLQIELERVHFSSNGFIALKKTMTRHLKVECDVWEIIRGYVTYYTYYRLSSLTQKRIFPDEQFRENLNNSKDILKDCTTTIMHDQRLDEEYDIL